MSLCHTHKINSTEDSLLQQLHCFLKTIKEFGNLESDIEEGLSVSWSKELKFSSEDCNEIDKVHLHCKKFWIIAILEITFPVNFPKLENILRI